MRDQVQGPPPANDNRFCFEAPRLRTARGWSRALYARSENVILPLRFAERMPGWQVRPARAP